MTLAVAGDDLGSVTGLFAAGAGLKAQLLPASTPLSSPLVTVKPGQKPAAPDAKKVRQFRVAIAPDAPLGIQEIRVFGPTGVSNARYFQVGDQPESVEQEPNDDSSGQLIQPPVVVNGRIQQDSDVDVYTFHGQKGERIVGEVYGERVLGAVSSDTWLKGYLELRDAAGHVLAANAGYYRWDPLIEYTLPADGDYSFAFRDLEYRGGPSAVYRLAIGALPRATALFPCGGRRGTTTMVTFVGDNLGPHPVEAVTIPADASLGTMPVRLHTPSGWTNALPFAVGDEPEVTEQEPNDDPARAMPVTPPVTINGRLDQPGDVDCYRVSVPKGETRLAMEVFSDRAESPMDSFLRLLDAKGNGVEENDDGIRERNVEVRSRDSRIERHFDAPGDYVVQIRDLDERGGDRFVYRLTIEHPKPHFILDVTPDRLLIHAGGTEVLEAAVDRVNLKGDITVGLTGLPPGLTATTARIPQGQDRARLTVTAAENLAGLAQPLVLHVSGATSFEGHLIRQDAQALTTYNVQGTAFSREVIGPVAASGPPAPVTLAAGPASLALKDGETAAIRVRVQRRPEASGEITLKLPGLPAGVTAEPVKVPAGSSEAQVLLKVDPDARAAETTLVLTGETKVGPSSLTVNAPALALTVTELPGFSLSLEPAEISAAQGSKRESAVTVKVVRRGGFDGPIDFSWRFPKANVTLPAGRLDAGRSETKLALTVPKSLPVGLNEAQLVATATIAGASQSREAGLKLTVTAAGVKG